MAKQTAAERKAQAAAEAQAKRVAEFQASLRRERGLHVVAKARDVFALGASVADPLFGKQDEQNVLYNALSRVESAKEKLASEVRWLHRAVEDAERYMAEGYCYSSSLIGSRGSDVDAAGAALRAAIDAARDVCRLLRVYCPLLHTVAEAKSRDEKLAYVVGQQADGTWYVRDPNDGTIVRHATEEAAWLALMETFRFA